MHVLYCINARVKFHVRLTYAVIDVLVVTLAKIVGLCDRSVMGNCML